MTTPALATADQPVEHLTPQELRLLHRVASARRGFLEQARDVPFLRRLRDRGMVERRADDADRWQLTGLGVDFVDQASGADGGESYGITTGTARAGQLPASERPTIIVGTDAEKAVEEATLALGARTDLFQRGGQLVRVIEDSGGKLRGLVRQPGAPRIQPIPLSQLRTALSTVADFRKVRFDARGQVIELYPGRPVYMPVLPPDWLCTGVLQLGSWPEIIRHLEAVVESPMLRHDGTVLQQPGYDADTGLLYLQPTSLRDHSIPEHPTRAEVEDAKGLLLDVVADFPFVTEAHRSAWLSGLLTYFARFAISGPCPLFLIDKNVRGAGSGLLAQVVGLICQGRDMALTSQATDEHAEKLMITSVAMSGELLVQIDNINRPLGSGSFDAALTTTSWTDRPLHTNDFMRHLLLAIWWATGNNVQIREGADTARRTLHMRLESPHEKPEQRSDFRHGDLAGYVRENRAQWVQAALTMLRGYCAAGKPGLGLPRWGGFDAWSGTVRTCIVWSGLADPYEAHESLVDSADGDMHLAEDLIFGWLEVLESRSAESMTVQDVLTELERDQEARRVLPNQLQRFDRLLSAVQQLCQSRDGRLPQPNILGNRLRRYKGRVVKGKRLEPVERTKTGWRWAVKGR